MKYDIFISDSGKKNIAPKKQQKIKEKKLKVVSDFLHDFIFDFYSP